MDENLQIRWKKLTLFEMKLKEVKIKYKKTRPYLSWQNGIVDKSYISLIYVETIC